MRFISNLSFVTTIEGEIIVPNENTVSNDLAKNKIFAEHIAKKEFVLVVEDSKK